MCGIFGLITSSETTVSYDEACNRLNRLYRYSESRGKESAGLHIGGMDLPKNWTLKGAIPATDFIRNDQYKSVIREALYPAFKKYNKEQGRPLVLLAHSRLVTNGRGEIFENNQPVHYGNVTAIHNGIIVNVDNLWESNPHLDRHAEVDTEVITALLSDYMEKGDDAVTATRKVFRDIKGAASIAWTANNSNSVILATNTGDLYYKVEPEKGVITFTSERYILKNAIEEKTENSENSHGNAIAWLPAGDGLVIDLESHKVTHFALSETNGVLASAIPVNGTVPYKEILVGAPASPNIITADADESLLHYNADNVRELKRCSRCILPETFPFIHYDEEGVCNYCHSYRTKYKGLEPDFAKKKFIDSLQGYRSKNGDPDVIVAFSGGRDSSYGLHLIKHEFGLTPITFTYDWGMVTDLARRNIARICGQLGIQNILVSADIRKKRENIRKNVAAWLKQPDLGIIPLFMAGDKHFFSVVNQLKRQTGIKLDLWSANPLENTDFKTGFCGVSPDFSKSRVDYLSLGRKAHLASYYMRKFITNPGYINSSIVDTVGAFKAYYVEPRRDFYFIFDHMVWNEDEVDDILLKEYDWELSPDSPSTWRIGDGTAPFYNYIYNTARGFSEFDTFRSNQIREGMISREVALEAVLKENQPRTPSLRWYLETINLDFNDTIREINKLDTLGLHRS